MPRRGDHKRAGQRASGTAGRRDCGTAAPRRLMRGHRAAVVRGALFPVGDEVEHASLVDGQGEQTVELFPGGVDAEDKQSVLSEVALYVYRCVVSRTAIT